MVGCLRDVIEQAVQVLRRHVFGGAGPLLELVGDLRPLGLPLLVVLLVDLLQDVQVRLHGVAGVVGEVPEVLAVPLALPDDVLHLLQACLEHLALPAQAQLLAQSDGQPRRHSVGARPEQEGLDQRGHHGEAAVPQVELMRRLHQARRGAVLLQEPDRHPMRHGEEGHQEEERREHADEAGGEHACPCAAERAGAPLGHVVERDHPGHEGVDNGEPEVPDHREDPDNVREAEDVHGVGPPDAVL
mmetsp:Transcript_98343/g.275356  ORF Transcript_98343/g.275356 Transcript_98343/m.275356 type:complete len:244 (-) Transcript_98343:971-1702(-)